VKIVGILQKLPAEKKGVKIAVISVPSRYIHSPVSIINKIDLENTYSLLLNFLKEVKNYG
jgi:putative aminopeptidase FrvX